MRRIPPLFKEIIRHEGDLREHMSRDVVNMFAVTPLIRRKRELMRAAERALSWNANKGTTA